MTDGHDVVGTQIDLPYGHLDAKHPAIDSHKTPAVTCRKSARDTDPTSKRQ